jgi:tyrosyl-DNA phosphodiesterase 2
LSEVLRKCTELQPSIICLQEVVPSWIEKCCDFAAKNDYDISDQSGDTVNPYGVLMMCKKELRVEFALHELPTHMCRKLLTASFQAPYSGGSVCVSTVHLESLASQTMREKQLSVCASVLQKFEVAFLCGDFNFCSRRNYSGTGELENLCLSRLMPEYQDTWLCVRPDEPGFTFDTDVNGMLNKDRSEQMRYDRIMFKSSSASIVGPVRASLIGNQCIVAKPPDSEGQKDSAIVDSVFSSPVRAQTNGLMAMKRGHLKPVPVFPSDHFGLIAEFECAAIYDDSTS